MMLALYLVFAIGVCVGGMYLFAYLAGRMNRGQK